MPMKMFLMVCNNVLNIGHGYDLTTQPCTFNGMSYSYVFWLERDLGSPLVMISCKGFSKGFIASLCCMDSLDAFIPSICFPWKKP